MKTKPRHRTKTYFEPSTVLLLKQIGLGLLVLSMVALLVTLIWFGTRLSSVTLADIEINGGVTINHDEVRSKAETVLSGTYLGIVPRKFIFFYPEEEIISKVAGTERIKDLVVQRHGTKLKITFSEYLPVALWCSQGGEEKCLFLDSNGYAFSPAPTLAGGGIVRYYTAEREPVVKETPFSMADFEATKYFASLLEEMGWYVSKVEVNEARDVFYSLSQGGELKATLNDDQKKPFENLRTILNSKEFAHLTPGNFQYLDLRFGTRVFVNEELLSSLATSTATTTASTTTEQE